MHRTIKSVLEYLCLGHPLRWPQLLQSYQITVNQAVHTFTRQQPYFAFFSRHPPWLVSAGLPSVSGEDEELAAAQALIRQTHQKTTRYYRQVASRKRTNPQVGPAPERAWPINLRRRE